MRSRCNMPARYFATSPSRRVNPRLRITQQISRLLSLYRGANALSVLKPALAAD
ncbi:hypothetical protein PLANPX_1552 [Lacipirellula parvula]|uniref:Uncharacterized protein n=1 Tax=Lacipirellula parvula TaxID=2650471 RepID=A0A5K7X5U7_9BACT|nr:hypothetical protein PLANPX_1552 [Lacipirellula parvula]